MRALHLALFASLTFIVAGAAGCTSGVAPVGIEEQMLATLPDCTLAQVSEQFQARPSVLEGFYVVRVGGADVCTTDFNGLELLDMRTDGRKLPPLATAESDPMPGHGTDPADSDPMPGHGTDPVASDPMPGRGNGDPLASDPMPGRNPETLRVARELALASH